MTLQEHITALASDKQFSLAISLTKLAVPIWENYVIGNELVYRDTVVGLIHKVDKSLLTKTITAVEEYLRSKKSKQLLFNLRTQYDDPIVALQDMDWDLPGEVQKTFYSVFNLLEACLGETETILGELTIYVSINQAIDALETSKTLTFEEIRVLLYDS